MQIEWTITKKAGHLRPKLHYRITLELFEIELAVPMVRIESTIPKPPDAGQHYVWPGTKECGRERPETVYELCTPSHKTASRREVVLLPLRPDGRYPEVDASFRRLRRAYEQALLAAYANQAFETGGRLGMTAATKRHLAPAVAARRFMSMMQIES